MKRCSQICAILFELCIVAPVLFASQQAFAGGTVSLCLVRMDPYGADAQTYSRAGWGGGMNFVFPIKKYDNVLAATGGLELVNLLFDSFSFWDRQNGETLTQETDQNYCRLYFGMELGEHGRGFFRPHAGADLALVYYYISTDLVIPNDDIFSSGENTRENLSHEGRFVLGYDLSMGVDLNFSNTVSVDGGLKYLKSFWLPQQLGEGTVTIHPQYFQVYFEAGVSFDFLESHGW